MTFNLWSGMANSQRYHLNPCLIRDQISLLFMSDLRIYAEKRHCTKLWELKIFKTEELWYLLQFYSDWCLLGLQVYRVYRFTGLQDTLSSLKINLDTIRLPTKVETWKLEICLNYNNLIFLLLIFLHITCKPFSS